jgi:hypothetical protein
MLYCLSDRGAIVLLNAQKNGDERALAKLIQKF